MSEVAATGVSVIDFNQNFTLGYGDTVSLSDGRFVVIWASDRDAIWGTTTYQQIFNQDGSPASDIQLVTPDTRTGVGSPRAVTALPDGGWVVAWTVDSTQTPIRLQAYNADGSVRGGLQSVSMMSQGDSGSFGGGEIELAALTHGGWVVTWGEYVVQNGYAYNEVYMKVFSNDASSLMDNQRITLADMSHESGPKVSALEDGGWVTTWYSSKWTDTGWKEFINYQVFNSDGSYRGSETTVDNGLVNPMEFRSLALADGGWVTVVTAFDASPYGLFLKVFNADGSPRTDLQGVNVETYDNQILPTLMGIETGGFVVFWQSSNQAAPGTDVFMRIYDGNGVAKTGDVLVNNGYVGDQSLNKVVALSDGGWLAVWTSGSSTGYMQAFHPDGTRNGAEKALSLASGGIVDVTALDNGGWVIHYFQQNVYGDRYISQQVYRPNNAPLANDITKSVYENTSVTIAVLSGAVDADGDQISLSSAKIKSGFGTVSFDGGEITYDPRTAKNQDLGIGDTSKVVIEYTITDAFGATDVGLLTVTVKGVESDVFNGSEYDDKIYGSIHGDVISGFAGNDSIDGRTGADRMYGGADDDTYYIDNVGDRVYELVNEGTDLVYSSVNFTLGSNVEKLVLTGGSDIDATGNVLANFLTGNSGSNRLDGKSGADTLRGKAGDDIYIVDNVGDRVYESSGEGRDTVRSSVTFSLGSNIENLVLTGDKAIDGAGNSAANALAGNSSDNSLDGKSGDDEIRGGDGDDKVIGAGGKDDLYGDTGADTFIYQSVKDSTVAMSGRDTIFDFSRSQGDHIDLSAIDANTKVSGNQAFSFVGTKAFSGKAGELRYEKTLSDTYIFVDVNGDKVADLAIHLDRSLALQQGDFLL